MELAELMTAFAAKNGIDGLAPDENGVYNLGIDDVEISIADSGFSGQLALLSEVGELPPEGAVQLFRSMMEAMYGGRDTAGVVFSVEHESQKIFAQYLTPLNALTHESFNAALEKFVDVLEQWRQKLADFRPDVASADSSSSSAAAEGAALGMPLGGFMQV